MYVYTHLPPIFLYIYTHAYPVYFIYIHTYTYIKHDVCIYITNIQIA